MQSRNGLAIVLANNQKVNLAWLFGFRKSLPGNGGSYDSDQRESPRLWSRAPVDLQLWLHAYFPQFGSKKVLIDNGSAFHVLPKATLSQLPVDPSQVRPSNTIVKALP